MRPPALAATLTAAVLLAGAAPALGAPQVHAHRGGTVADGVPKSGEESMRAYRAAAKHGFVLEVDAKLTEDGVPVAVHDATLDRTTNCSGELRTFTLSELVACSTDVLGSPGSPLRTRPAPRGIPIATIGGVLTFARLSGAEVNLEIKNVPTDPDYDSTPAFANRVMDAVLRSRIPRSQLMIQSFIPQNLEVARRRLPGVETSLLGVQSINEPYLGVAASNGYDWISPQWPVTEDYVNRAHAANLAVAPFTLDAAVDVRAAQRMGVEAIITDDPFMAARALGLRPVRHFAAWSLTRGRRLEAFGKLLAPGVPVRQACRGRVTMRVMAPEGRLIRRARGRVNRNCEFFFGARRTPPRMGPPLVTIRFEGNSRLLPRLDGPERPRRRPPPLP